MIVNAGIPGNTSGEVRARIHADALSLRPDLVVLMVGANDALNSAKLAPCETTRDNLHELATAVRSQCSLLLVTPIPFHERLLLTRHRVAAYGDVPPAQRLRRVVEAVRGLGEALRVPVVDAFQVFSGVGLIGDDQRSLIRNQANSGADDGVHPTGDGYRVLATAIAMTLTAHGLPRERIVCIGDSITFGQYVPGEGTATGETYPGWLARMLVDGS